MQLGQRKATAATYTLLLALALATGGCEAKYRKFDSTNPLVRAQAAIDAGATADFDAVPRLVDLLEDRDAAVRMYAIQSLRRLCGEDFGYRHYGTEVERKAAVQRWRAAVRAGTLRPVPVDTQPTTAPQPEDAVVNGKCEAGMRPGALVRNRSLAFICR